MTVRGLIKKGAYFDSITLMRVGKAVSAMAGVSDASLIMGTHSNKSILVNSGLQFPELDQAGDTDLIIVVKAEKSQVVDEVLKSAEVLLKSANRRSDNAQEMRPVNLDGALQSLPGANMAVISIAGRYAAAEARKALEKGLHVMLFSDNVSLEQEIELKKLGRERGLLVMGPDCGTAIINGVPLAFANVVSRGCIGIVAAAGTGLQEVSTLISNAGQGVSQAIGTGGRDVKKEVGGIMFIEGLKALAADDETKVILLVSKPPHAEVLARVQAVIRETRKPVVSMLLGAASNGQDPETLEEAALMAVALAEGRNPGEVRKKLLVRDAEIKRMAESLAATRGKGQRYIRALFSGGTFCAEAQIIFSKLIKEVSSNAPAAGALKLEDSLRSVKHTVVDLGEDEFTVGRPHPMIDFSLRNKRILAESEDPETAVILLDVVLGYGSHPDPAAELFEVVQKAVRKVSVICSITGTDGDPQHRGRQEQVLKEAGAIVMPSNAAACRLAVGVVQLLGGLS
ncbi:MAG: acyl-CoA synthetase FdrA [Lentisphaerota bacterium]